MAFPLLLRSALFSLTVLVSSVCLADDEQRYTLNMQDADIKEVIDLVAKVTGKTFIIDPRVRGKVTVVSDREMTQKQIYETFLATLEVYGFSAVQAGDVTKVIGQADIKSAGIDVETEGGRVGEEIITRVFPIQNASAMELVPILRPLVAKYGHLAGVSSANVLIVADRATNIDRLSEIVRLLDKAGSAEIEVISLKHAWVSSMITLLERISPSEVSASSTNINNRPILGRTVQLVGDERSNRIIVKGEKEARTQIIELIQKLDTPTEENTSYKVIFLNNADAAKMAEILKGISLSGGAGEAPEAPPSTGISILADEDQNALIIRAEPNEIKEIEQLINQLDIPRQQVMIEAAIVEVSGSISEALGIQWATNPESTRDGMPFVSHSNGALNDNRTLSSLGTSVASSVAENGAIGALASIPVGTSIAFADPIGNKIDFGVIIQALESQSNANFLSTPSVITLDNSEAFITVGQSVPFVTGGNGTEDNPFAIEREDVGTTLTVIPHIQQNGLIRLEVDQVVESVDRSIQSETQNVVTKKRQVKTQVLIQNRDTIVLGGLISDEVDEIESRVPVLSKIPLLGKLFRSSSLQYKKNNLLVILRPIIIKDNMDEYRKKRLTGVWELRIETGGSNYIRPSVDDIFNGDYITGGKQRNQETSE